jgi:uncharacterized protein YbbC (DUF1343 family)
MEKAVSRIASGLERFLDPTVAAPGISAGARIGLLCHPASIDAEGRHAAERILKHARFRLVRLFAPEHGVAGEAQDMEAVGETRDAATGLPVVSLYGTDVGSLAPSPSDLDGLDAVVCDLQDVGSRYYTFVYTIAHVMEAAGKAGVPVVVLDRPNPIGGDALEGPLLDPELASFVGRYPIPVRHGMTPAELAGLFRAECGVACDLRVVPMAGYTRAMRFEDTGLPWVAPSPNMPTTRTAEVYPGACLVEGTNLSEARGTTRPFELVGAPWLPGGELVKRLRRAELPGCVFRETTFRPAFQKHAGRSCSGLQVHVTDRRAFRPFATYLVLLSEAIRLSPGEFDWRREPYEFETRELAIDLLLGTRKVRPMLESGAPLDEIERTWEGELSAFLLSRRAHLLYGD